MDVLCQQVTTITCGFVRLFKVTKKAWATQTLKLAKTFVQIRYARVAVCHQLSAGWEILDMPTFQQCFYIRC